MRFVRITAGRLVVGALCACALVATACAAGEPAGHGQPAAGPPAKAGTPAVHRPAGGRDLTGDLPELENELEGLSDESVIPAAEERLIDLPTALQLAEAENPTIALGRQAIVEAVALQTGARGLLLPTLNAGTNYHLHQGVLQSSFGQIRNLNEQSLYVGGGARTLAAETVAVPAVRIFSHLGGALVAPLGA